MPQHYKEIRLLLRGQYLGSIHQYGVNPVVIRRDDRSIQVGRAVYKIFKDNFNGVPVCTNHGQTLHTLLLESKDQRGRSYQLRQRCQIIFTECGADLAAASLATQMEKKHVQPVCAVAVTMPDMIPAPPVEYQLYLFWNSLSINCLVKVCSEKANNCPKLRIHFIHCNMEDTIVILNEVNNLHTRWDQCGMFIPRCSLEEGHINTTVCKRLEEQNHRHLLCASAQEAARTEFRVQEYVIYRVDTFMYLGWVLFSDDSYCPDFSGYLKKAGQKWGGLS